MNVLFTVALFELYIGGGGRLLEIGPFTVRMVLFAICLIATVVHGLNRPHRADGVGLALVLVGVYLVLHGAALVHGTLAGADVSTVLTELQQSLYWLAAPFIAMVLQSQAMVHRTADIVRLSGVVLATIYLLTIASLAAGLFDYVSAYATLSESSEFAFRSENLFFYKGFLYLGIAVVFFVSVESPHSRLFALLILTAMALTLTRGFILSTSLALATMLIAQKRWKLVALVGLAFAAAAFFVWIYVPSVEEGLDAQREISNLQRLDDFAYIIDRLDVQTVLSGQGLGVPVGDRINIENTFLWALWRLGLPGVLFWLAPLAICFAYYMRIPRKDSGYRLGSAFAFAALLVYLQTLANPYLNNPIGLSFVLVAMFSLRRLARGRSPFTLPRSRASSLATRSLA